MQWRIRISAGVRRSIAKLPTRIRDEVIDVLRDLRDDPRPAYSKPLGRELQGLRTIRIDGWRLVYSVNDADQIVLVVAIRQRGPNTYLNLVL
ncbi:MAG: type II toxin-antitoxin system RelE/ParE family toxin [Caldilineaceae bacterium]